MTAIAGKYFCRVASLAFMTQGKFSLQSANEICEKIEY
jgi:hypothetical protein